MDGTGPASPPAGGSPLATGTFAGMSIRKFAGEEAQELFLDWVSQKPKGYVLNTDSGLSDRGEHPASPGELLHARRPLKKWVR